MRNWWGASQQTVDNQRTRQNRKPNRKGYQPRVEALEDRCLMTAGMLDLTFDTDGKVITDLPGASELARALAIQADGKTVVAGFATNPFTSRTDFAITRYLTTGAIDANFGSSGTMTTDFGTVSQAFGVAIQADGKIVVVGRANVDMAVVRYNTNGTLDTTFGVGGKVVTDFNGFADRAFGVVIQADGKILVGGDAIVSGTNRAYAAVRYNADGSLDTSFDGDGKVVVDLSPSTTDTAIAGIAIHQDAANAGKIVLGGMSFTTASDSHVALVQLNSDGSLDTGFGTSGVVITAPNAQEVRGLAIDSVSGQIYLGGMTGNLPDFSFVISRFDGTTGAVDTSFDHDGTADGWYQPGFGTGQRDFTAIVIQADHKIVAAGITGTSTDSDYAAMRFNTDGTLDTTFGLGGLASVDLGGNKVDNAWGVGIQVDGKLVLAGGANVGTSQDFGIIRLTTNGALDTSFDGDGRAITNFTGAILAVGKELRQPDGKIVVAGVTRQAGLRTATLWRYNADGTLDTSFSGDGVAFATVAGTTTDLFTVAIQPDGKLVAAGRVGTDLALFRFNNNGTLDTSFDTDGIAQANLGFALFQSLLDMFIMGDGRIVVSGYPASATPGRFAVVARFNGDGSLDTSFDGDGKVTVALHPTTDTEPSRAMTVDSLGRIILVGCDSPLATDPEDIVLLRLNTDGSLDSSFGSGGVVLTNLSATFEALVDIIIQPDDKLVTVGRIQDAGGKWDMALVRYNTDGTLDTSFGTGGSAILDANMTSNDTGIGVKLLPDGRFVTIYSVPSATNGTDVLVAKWRSNGTLDTTFGTGGIASFDFLGQNDLGRDIVVTDNGAAAVVLANVVAPGFTGDEARRLGLLKVILNEAPTANPGGGYSIQEGDSLNLDGFGSTDPDNEVLTYSWDINGDGVYGDVLGHQPTVTWTALQALGITDGLDTFNVSIRVSDGSGHTDTSGPVTLTVTNRAPTLTISGSSSTGEGTYTLNLASSDPGDDTIDHWTINWGDGTAAQTVTGNPSSVTHVYDGPRNYTITAKATDEDGTFNANSVSVRINNVAPTLTLTGAGTTNEGSTYTLNLASVDPGIDTIQKWTITWGDGSVAQVVAGNPSSVNHVYTDGLKNVTISATATNEDGTFASNALAVTVQDVTRVATISGPASLNEGSLYTLHLNSTDPGADKVSKWVINWGDGVIQTVIGSPAAVSHAYISDGTRSYTISATAFDEDGSYATNSVALTVNNVAPTAKVIGPTQGLAGQLLTFTLSATDPSTVDRASGFTYTIDWGDGSAPQTTAIGSGISFKVQHAFTGMGAIPVQVTATDKDGGVSVVASWTVLIPTDGLHQDPLDSSKTALFVSGGTGNDAISITANGTSQTSVIVTVNGVRQGVFSPTGRIYVYGETGNDTISVAATVKLPTVLDGGDGNDVITGGAGTDIILGGAGNDSLRGGLARDLILGGLGADTLFGDIPGQYARAADGGNLLIGNPSVYDDHLEQLAEILAKWTSAASFDSRTSDLTSGAGVPPLTLGQLTDDSMIDKLYGGGGQDWFWATPLQDQTLFRQTTGTALDKVN